MVASGFMASPRGSAGYMGASAGGSMDAKVNRQDPHMAAQRKAALPSRGGEMAYLDFGPAERPVDVVFSHANGFNARTYRTILEPLAGEMRILAIDLRGHGATTLPTVIEGRDGW